MFTPIIEELDELEETSREDVLRNFQYSVSFGIEYDPEHLRNFESEQFKQEIDQKLKIEQIALEETMINILKGKKITLDAKITDQKAATFKRETVRQILDNGMINQNDFVLWIQKLEKELMEQIIKQRQIHQNRRVNAKITNLKNLLSELDHYLKKFEIVISANEEQFEKMRERNFYSARQYIFRFSECLHEINVKIGWIERDLEYLKGDLQKVKVIISDFEPVIQIFQQNLWLKVAIAQETNLVFTDLKNRIHDIINNLKPAAKKFKVDTCIEILKVQHELVKVRMHQQKSLLNLDEKRVEDHEALLKIEYEAFERNIILSDLMPKFLVDDRFEQFLQMCNWLIDSYRKFCSSYTAIEEDLLKIDSCMKTGRELSDFDMPDLLSNLRVLSNSASQLNTGGSTEEEKFTGYIVEVIQMIRDLTSELHTTDYKIGGFEFEPDVPIEAGISGELDNIGRQMQKLGEKIRLFNVRRPGIAEL